MRLVLMRLDIPGWVDTYQGGQGELGEEGRMVVPAGEREGDCDQDVT